MDLERNIISDKRRQEREYLQKMLLENERLKAKAVQEKGKERDEDIKA